MKTAVNLKPNNIFITLAIFTLFLSKAAFAVEQPYDVPLKFNQRYVTSPEKVIIDSLLDRGWEVKNQKPGTVTGWLNDYKDYEIILDINYDDSEISFKHISAKKLRCGNNRSTNCKVQDKHYNKWRLYLRKSIALNIHTLAISELLAIPSIKNNWLASLKEGSIKEKIKFARNIIDIELFDKDALNIIEEEIIKGYKKTDMSGNEVQLYAFYCKVLARTADSKYLALLTEVKDNTVNRKLKNYVDGYLTRNYSSTDDD